MLVLSLILFSLSERDAWQCVCGVCVFPGVHRRVDSDCDGLVEKKNLSAGSVDGTHRV